MRRCCILTIHEFDSDAERISKFDGQGHCSRLDRKRQATNFATLSV